MIIDVHSSHFLSTDCVPGSVRVLNSGDSDLNKVPDWPKNRQINAITDTEISASKGLIFEVLGWELGRIVRKDSSLNTEIEIL